MKKTQKFNLDEFKKSLEGKTLEELAKIEQEVIAECEAVDKKVSETKFELPQEGYASVAEKIKYFLNKQTVQWQYTLTMATMYDFWNTPQTEIPYAQLDSTLRTIGEMQFTGYDDWTAIIEINKYFEGIKDKFTAITQEIYDAAGKHNVVMQQMELNTPQKSDK